jgi:hypothetical protein
LASAKAYIAFFLILLVAAGVVLALGEIPAAAFGGSTTPICNTTLIVEGTYNDNGQSHWVSGFVFQYGATQCAAPSALDLLGVPEYQQLVVPQNNILPLSFTFSVQIIDSSGVTHGPYTITVNIPALQYQYYFSAQTIIKGVPEGSYQANIGSSTPFTQNGTNGCNPTSAQDCTAAMDLS